MAFLDRYRELQVLAERDAVTTRLCEDTATGERVVVRTLALSRARSHEEVALFERESGVLAHLDHPRLPRTIATLQEPEGDDVRLHQVRRYIEGRSLYQEARAGRHLTEREALLTALGVARTLAYLHQRSPPLVHRDLKPHNLIRTGGGPDDENVAVIDLGAVKAGPSTGNTVVGTYGYMPPEQYEGQSSPRSDLYALGMTLIFLLTHKEPGEFGDEGARTGYRRHANISEACAALVDTLIAFDPAARPRDGAAAAAAIERVLRGDASPSTRVEGDARPRSHLAATVGLLAALVTMGGVAALIAVLSRPAFVVVSPPVPTVPTVPTVPAPPTVPSTGAAKQAPLRFGELEPLLLCTHRLIPRLIDSEARYLSWVNPAKGPTGKERHTYGLYAGYDDAIEKCAQVPEAGDLASTLLPLVKRASRYYDEEDYRDDAFAEGQRLHPELLRGFAQLHEVLARLEAQIETGVANLAAGVEDESARGIVRAVKAATALAAVSPRTPAEAVDARKFGAAYEGFATAVDVARASTPKDRSFRSFAVDRLEHHRTWAKRLLRIYQDGKRSSEKRRWDPDEVRETTHGLLVDLVHLQRANTYTW